MVFDFDADTCTLPGFKKDKIYQALGPAGSIGLQVHRKLYAWPKGKKSYWRNIRIKELNTGRSAANIGNDKDTVSQAGTCTRSHGKTTD